ncbi:MAG: hypothetical protein IPG71_03525 [bacterium]|nr:hypothetical protein [bacterium]
MTFPPATRRSGPAGVWQNRLLWLLERPWLVWLALFPVAVIYTRPFLWGGDDAWEMAAAIRAAAESLLDPRNPMLALPGDTSPRFTPYVIGWGAFMNVTGLSVYVVLQVTALLNYVLFATGLTRFVTVHFDDKRLATVLIPVLFFVWGTSYGQANAYNFWFFFFSLPYVSTFAFGIGFHALAELATFLKQPGLVRIVAYLLLAILAFLCHPITGLFVFAVAFVMALFGGSLRRAVYLQAAPVIALLCALAWPYFDYGKVFLSGTQDAWYMPEMFSHQLPALGTAFAGFGIAVYFLFQRRHRFAVTLLGTFTLVYLVSWATDIYIGERFLLFAAFALHLLIALIGIQLLEDWLGGGSFKDSSFRFRIFTVLLIGLGALPFRDQDIRMTGSLLISNTVMRRHGETMREHYQFLEEHLRAGDVVLAEGMDGWTLPAISGARIVFQRHGNPLLTTELETRLAHTNAFLLGAANEQERSAILDRYGVTHVLLNLREPSAFSPNLPAYLDQIGTRVAEQNELVLYRVRAAA